MRFDGRSYSDGPPRLTRSQRIAVHLASRVMPAITQLLMSDRVNTCLWRLLGVSIGPRSRIRRGTWINVPHQVSIGADCLIHGHLKSRGGIVIGDGVELVEDVLVSTQSHNVRSPRFESIYSPVTIGRNAWIGPRAIVLQGVSVAEGCVAGAGAVITRNTSAWSVVAGVPAVPIASRPPLSPDGLLGFESSAAVDADTARSARGR